MNITSASPPNGLSVGALTRNNSHKLEDLRKVYADAMIQQYNQTKKSKNKIRIKNNKNKQQTNKLEKKAVSLPQRTVHPILSMKEIRISNLNQIISDASDKHMLPEENNPHNIRRELLFLRDIVNKRRQVPDHNGSRSSSVFCQSGQIDKNHPIQDQPTTPKKASFVNKNFLQGQAMSKTSMLGWQKKVDEYQHYDSVVKDLLSQIKLRKQSSRKSMRPTISPKKYSESKEKIICKADFAECNFKSVIKVQPKKDNMIFRMTEFMADNVYERKITSYIMFLYKVNFSNSIYVDLTLSNPGKMYKAKIGAGNNCTLIKSLVKRRFWLDTSSSNNTTDPKQISFIWTQNTLDNFHNQQQSNTQEKKIIDEEKQQKFVKKLKKLKKSKKVLEMIQLNEKILNEQDINEAETNYYASNNGNYSIYQKVQPKIVTNHIPHNYIIGSKKILFMLMHWYYQEIKKVDPFIILPKTYHIRSGQVNNPPFKKFLESEGERPDGIWIVKPGENTNRGNGITVASFSQVSRLIRKREVHRNGQEKTYIIQKYLKPFLYNSRKFDIRHYLLITSVNGYIKAFWYKEGYIRTSSEKYDLDDLSNEFVHLTNDAIQKKSEYYGKYEPGNKVSYSNFQRYLDQSYPHKKYSFETQILQKMKEITTQMIQASFSFMDPERKNFNFELYGMDFMIDSKFRPYLIEVNANPCLETSCPLLQRIIPILTEHTFRLALDPLFPPPQHFPSAARYQLSDRILEKLKYELIFDQKYEGKQLRETIDGCEVKFSIDPKQSLQADEELFDNDGQQIKDLQLD